MNTPDLHLLALELEAHGFVGHDAAIDALSRSARSAGLSPVLIDVLGDAAAPEVARLRAFGTLAARLARVPASQPAMTVRPRASRRSHRPDVAAA